MLDNGAFSGNFVEEPWKERVRKLSRFSSSCLGIILPDYVLLGENKEFLGGDWKETLKMAHEYSPFVRSMGLPAAYALQDNHDPKYIPWDLFETLFVGCANDFKFSKQVEQICLEAKRRGKWVHHGRVSSALRMKQTYYADSWDTTAFIYDADEKRRVMESALKQLSVSKQPFLI